MKPIIIILLLAVLPMSAAVDVLLLLTYGREYWSELDGELTRDSRLGDIGHIDVHGRLPSPEEMEPYDVVVVDWDLFYAHGFHNPSVLGDLLADYVDDGGHVIILGGALADDPPYTLAGRITEAPYSPLLQGWYVDDGFDTEWYRDYHPIFNGVYPPWRVFRVMDAILAADCTLLAEYEDSHRNPYPEAAVNPSEDVVAINLLYSDRHHDWYGHGDKMVANACWWLGEGGAAVVETSWGAIKATNR